MLFNNDVRFLKEVEDWFNLEEEKQEQIAEENDWFWYFEWYDEGYRLWKLYEKADKDKNCFKKLNAYDNWDKEPFIRESYSFLGIDACFHESPTPTHTWKEWQPCTNKTCKYNQGKYSKDDDCGFFGCNERMYDCFGSMFATLQMVCDLCGYDGLYKVQNKFNIHSDIIGWFIYGQTYFSEKMKPTRDYNLFIYDLIEEYSQEYDNLDIEWAEQYYVDNFLGMSDKEYIYEYQKIIKKGDDKMSKNFIQAFNDLNKKDDLAVYWNEGQMYINDESDSEQAITSTSLFDAYRFTLLINAPNFDYTASDKEVEKFQKQLNKYYKETDGLTDTECVDVWEYLDDIAKDFNTLTGKTINDIDIKRSFVASMSDTSENECGMMFGSATYIAKWLWENIKGGNFYKGIEPSNNATINELADKYLQSDEHDIIKFAKALHKAVDNQWYAPQTFRSYLEEASKISQKCYYLLGELIEQKISYKSEFLVGYIDWFGDEDENERYIYCHIDSDNDEIYFQQNRKDAPKNAHLHDIAFHHMIFDQKRIQKDIKIKFTNEFVDDIVKDKVGDYEGSNWGYIHCHMYHNTIGAYN